MKNLIVQGWQISKKNVVKELRKVYPNYIYLSQIYYKRGGTSVFFPNKDLTEQQVFHFARLINAELTSLSEVRAVLTKK
jgi:hypothetical protein